MIQPMLLPVSLNLQGKICLVIGGGKVAEKRVRSLLACHATVRVVSPQVTPWLAKAATRGAIAWEQHTFQTAQLTAGVIVFIATADPQTNAGICTAAKQHGCLVNVADDPAHCDFYMPAVVRRGHLTMAISTAGQAPAFAAWLGRQFERLLDHRLENVVRRYAHLRPSMKQRYPDMSARVRAWEALITTEAPQIFHPVPGGQRACRTTPTVQQARSICSGPDQGIRNC